MSHILVVDDQEINRDLLVRRLFKRGYQVSAADGGKKALEMIDGNNEIDLVLLDVRMPGMDGNDVLKKIRIDLTATDLPVIMVTAESDPATMIKSLGFGADDYVTKPIDMPVLAARIESKLDLRKSVRRQLEETANAKDSFPDTARIKQLIVEGENNEVEFKSTLRWNVYAKKFGSEIEIAWLKTIVAFLNTGGGTLLVGVKDNGEILGTDLDKFSNDDKYMLHVNNLVKKRIGMEHTNQIAFDLVAVDKKKVLCVECKSGTDAVFLKNGSDEEFYVRFGPATRKLTGKEMLAFVSNG